MAKKQKEVNIVKVENGWEVREYKNDNKKFFCEDLENTIEGCNIHSWVIMNLGYVFDELDIINIRQKELVRC